MYAANPEMCFEPAQRLAAHAGSIRKAGGSMRVEPHSGQEPGWVSRARRTNEYPQAMQLAGWMTSRSPRARSDFSRCSRCPATSFSRIETRSEISRAVAAPRRSSSRMASRTVRVRSMPEACSARRRCQSNRPQGLGDPARVERELAEVAADRIAESDEMQARRARVGGGAVHQRQATIIQHAEAADESLEPAHISGGSDDRVRLDAIATFEQHVTAVEAAHSGDDGDAALLERVDEPHVQDRDLSLPGPRVRPARRRTEAVRGQVADREPGHHARDRIDDRHRRVAQ